MSNNTRRSCNVDDIQGLDAAARLLQGPISENGLCLLSLDGGGVRGLSTLLILRYLMAKINFGRPPNQQKKPFEVFDMIGGTSTGGLIAIMLGRLKMGVQECIDLYNSMFREIFGSPIHNFPITVGLQIQSRFDSRILRRCITKIVGQSRSLRETDVEALANAANSNGPQTARESLIAGVAAKVLLDDGDARGCHTFVCATTVEDQRTVRFRDYPRADLGIPSNISIVDAACATSAATSYFDAVNVNGRLYRDGGFGANNPVTEVWHEAREIWIKDDYEIQLDDLLKCYISIGTGFPKTEGMKEDVKGFVGTLKSMVTQTNRTANDFMRNHRNFTKIDGSQRYFRFNVEQGLQDVGLEEWIKVHIIETATEGYMESPERENLVALCANNMRMKASYAKLELVDELKNYQKLTERNPAKLTFKRLIAWLNPDLSYFSSHSSIRNKDILSQTGRWVFEDLNFNKWRNNMGGRIWLHGKVGSGKTILCYSIIEWLRAQVKAEDESSRPVLFFYFSFKSSDQQTLESFLITIIYQICAIHGIPDPLQALYTKFRDMAPGHPRVQLPPKRDLELAFSAIIRSLPNGGYLIMDAMDEIPYGKQRDQFLIWLRSFSHQDSPKLSILVSSQGEPDFKEQFQWDLGWAILGLVPSKVDVDIGFFIHHELITNPSFSKLSQVNRCKIENDLISKSKGSFRWADVILQILQQPRVLRPYQIEEMLRSLPKGLTESYDRLLKRVDKAVSEDVAVALKWLSLSKRPLFIEEVIEGAMLNPYMRPSRNSKRQLSATDLLSCLTGLVTIEPQLPATEGITIETHVLSLAHSSVRDYLLSENEQSTPIFPQDHFSSLIAHEFIARSCVEYLEHCGLASWIKDHYPLAKYSKQYWHQHAKHVPGLLKVLESLSKKAWSPILYPPAGKIPMLRACNMNGIGEDFANVSRVFKHAPSESADSMTFEEYHYSPLEQSDQCRVVVLLPSNHWEDPIECRMEIVSLLHSPYYCVLSYFKDYYSSQETIIVDGFSVHVDVGLGIALRYLRQAQKGYPQVFWIDALSINDRDNSEVEHQFLIKSSIFKNARKVVVWLGPDDATSEIAMKCLEKFETIPDTPESVKNGLLSMSEFTWAAVQKTFQREWFSQIESVTAVAIAKEVDIVCGNRNIPWSILERIDAAVIEFGPEIQQYKLSGSNRLSDLVKIQRVFQGGKFWSMPEAMAMTYNFTIGEVYSRCRPLLILYVDEDTERKLLANHSHSTTELYSRIARDWLAFSQDLDLFSYCTTKDILDSKKPSWAPDWYFSSSSDSLDPFDEDSLSAKQPQRLYNVTLGSSTSMEFAPDGDIRLLQLSGIRVGYLDNLGNNFNPYRTSLNNQLHEWKKLMDVPHVIERYKHDLQNDVFIRTILADQEYDINLGRKRLGPRIEEIQNDETYQALQNNPYRVTDTRFYRIFMVTDEGYVGLCPNRAQVGDEVFLLHGGRVPYILRSQHLAGQQLGTYKLVGTAYVHGIMDGELLKSPDKNQKVVTVTLM